MTIGELIVKLGFKSDNKTLRSFIHDIGDLNLASVFAATGLGAMYEGLKNIMDQANSTALSFNTLSKITGVSQQEFEKWERAATMAGLSTGEASKAISDLQSSIFDLIRSGTGGGQFIGQLLHMDPRTMAGHPDQVMDLLLKKLHSMDDVSRRFFIQMTGLPDRLLLLADNIDKVNSGLTNSNEEFSTLADWQKTIGQLSYDWKVLIVSIGALMAHIFKPFIDGLDLIFELVEVSKGWLGPLTAILALSWGITAAWKANPLLTVIAAGITALGFLNEKFHLSDLLVPQTNSTSQFDNSGDTNVNNTYNINGGNSQDVNNTIRKHWAQVTQDADLQRSQQTY